MSFISLLPVMQRFLVEIKPISRTQVEITIAGTRPPISRRVLTDEIPPHLTREVQLHGLILASITEENDGYRFGDFVAAPSDSRDSTGHIWHPPKSRKRR